MGDEGMDEEDENPQDADCVSVDDDEVWLRVCELLSCNEAKDEEGPDEMSFEERDDEETISYDGFYKSGKYAEAYDAVEPDEAVEPSEYAETYHQSPYSCFDTASESEPEPNAEPIEVKQTESESK